MSKPTYDKLVFIDTETTGLDVFNDQVWELACIVRRPGYPDSQRITQAATAPTLIEQLPARFRDDHQRRFDPEEHCSQAQLAEYAEHWTDGAHLVGANIAFDAAMLTNLLRTWGRTPRWHYHLIDVETLTVGYLAALGSEVELPWRSDDLAGLVGLDSSKYDRHTALGDALWVRDWYDALTTDARRDRE